MMFSGITMILCYCMYVHLYIDFIINYNNYFVRIKKIQVQNLLLHDNF
jgi:hypothetical protein